MKKIAILIFGIIILTTSRGISQNYYMNTVNGTTITTCRGNVMPSWTCAAFGYAAYCNNENYTVTFYSGSPTIPMRISFLSLGIAGFPTTDVFYTEGGYDYLTIIDGPSIGSPTLAALTGTIANTFSYTSTGGYLTLNFKSDVSVNDWGWFAIIGCQPQGCAGNLPAGDFCASATAICDINGYCGSTNGWYTPDNANLGVNLGGPFCGSSGSIENNAWIKFIPSAASATVNINVANCSSATQGLQAGLFATNCSTFALLTCQSQATYAPVMSLTYSSFVPGQVYYLMIDGYAGNACDYTVSASGGVAVSTISATSNTICSGQSTNLTASAAGSSPTYTWSTGASSSGITVSPTITTVYSATIASGFCTEIITKTITVNALPTANAGTSPASITCTNPTRTLSGSGGGTYVWSGPGIVSGGTSATPVVNQAGTYTLVVTSAAGCISTNVATVSVPINTTTPTAAISVPAVLNCTNTTMALGGSPASGVSYSWNGPSGFTSTNQNPNVTLPGTYSLTVTSTVNGCPNTTSTTVTQNTVQPSATASSTGSVTCATNTISLLAGPGSMNYTWTAPGGSSISSGTNAVSATGQGAGTYTVNVQDPSNGCSRTATVAANVNTVQPNPTAGTTGSITCSTNTISLTSNLSGMNYTWTAPGGSSISTGTNSQNATGQGSGTYSITVSNPSNGCSRTVTVAAIVNTVQPNPTASTGGSVTCATNTITLSTNLAGMNYTWTAPGGSSISTGTNSQNANGQGSGVYTVNVQNPINGCSNTATVSALINTVAPTPVSATTSGTATCSSLAINLSASPAGMSYSWTAPAGSSITSGSTSQNATASGAGSYSVLITSTINGCSTQTTVAALVNTVQPNPTAGTSGSITCTTNTITLTSNLAGMSYTWTAPGGSSITTGTNTQNATGQGSGTYTVLVRDVNGCSNTATVSANVNLTVPATPTASVIGSLSCAASQVTLTAVVSPTNAAVTWTPTAGICGSPTSLTTTACSAGTYSVFAINPLSNCPSASAATVNVAPSPGSPIINSIINTGTITCTNTLVVITASVTGSTLSYSWTGSGISGASTNSVVNVTAGGLYTLVVTNSASCTASSSHSIVADNAAITPTTTASNTITCNTTTVNLSTNAGAGTYNYNWSGPAVVGTATLSSATASLGGVYSVTVTNTANGCVGTGTVSVVSNTTVPTGVAINPATFTLSCATPTTVLTATATGATSYTWIAPAGGSIVSGTNTANAGISGSGTYSVIVAGANGCPSAAAEVTVSPNNNAPTFTLSNVAPSITCYSATPSVSVTITSTVPITSYSWTPASGISGSSTSSVVTFTTAGTYTGVITANNGCISNAIISVSDDTTLPNVVAGTATTQAISCANPSVVIAPTFTPTSGLTYTWTGPGVIGSANDASVTVNQSGTYSLAVTNTLTGCASTIITVPVVGTNIAPLLNVTSSSSIGIGCLPGTSTVVLTANATPSSGVTYSWSSSATTSTISVTAPGVYSVVVTDISTSCSVAVQYTVDNNVTAPSLSVVANAIMPCGSVSNTTLNATTTSTNVVYSWTGPSIVSGSNTATPVVNLPGTYSLTLNDPITGCSSTATVLVINGVPTASFTANVTSGYAPLTVDFTNQSSGAILFNWNFGNGNSTAINPTNIFTAPGTYSVVLIATSGICSDTTSMVIIVDAGFNVEIPNVFTPNNDGTNDVFTIKSTGVKEITLEIYNRWGQKMYEFTGAKAAWDGVTANGNEASAGTYFFFIKATGVDGTLFEKQGTVSLFR